MQTHVGTIVCKFGGDPAIRLREYAIFVKSQIWQNGEISKFSKISKFNISKNI